jgi:peptidoglycan/LPS O-acetylase OafA/YrhL
MRSKAIYFPGLNGLRAIAAVAVVISHVTLALQQFNLNPYILGKAFDGQPKGLTLAGYGVSIFFVLSGFLITYLLEAEKLVTDIDIKKFYFRRILRIWPLYYLYLLLCVIAIIIFKLDLNIQSLFFYIFYAANVPFILGTMLPFLAHYWSLGVEEQFYLFWPWVIKKIDRYLIPILVVAIMTLISAKVLLHIFRPGSILETTIHVTRFHCMMIGALGAILYRQENRLFLWITDNKIAQAIAWLAIFLVAINKFHIASIIDTEIISLVGLTLIIGQIRIKNRLINLEKNILDFLGKISYGIYVIHPLLIFLIAKVLCNLKWPDPLRYFLAYTSVLGTTIVLSYLSYNYFEKYFLKLKKRFVVVNSSPTKNPDADE